MNHKRPLSYLSLKCVLSFCKADFRIFLNQHFPSIARIRSDSKIEKLHLKPFSVKLNSTEYLLEVIQKPKNLPPIGHFQCDLDEFGVPEEDSDAQITPGDVEIQPEPDKFNLQPEPDKFKHVGMETFQFILTQFLRDVPRNDPIHRRKQTMEMPNLVDKDYCSVKLSDYVWLSGNTDDYREAIEKGRGRNTSGNNDFVECGTRTKDIDGCRRVVDIYSPNSGPFLYIAHRDLSRIERISLIEQVQAFLLPLQCRHSKISPPFKCYLQLTTVSPRGKTTEMMEYTQKLNVAMKYLNAKLFGGRSFVKVDHLKISEEGGILRLPYSLKMQIDHLEVGENGKTVIEAINGILDESSFPLKSAESYCWKEYALFYTDIVHEAQKLIIPFQPYSCGWEYTLNLLKNRHVHMKKMMMTVEHVMKFLHNFREFTTRPKIIGDCFSFGITCPRFSDEMLAALLETTDAKLVKIPGIRSSSHFPHCLNFPLNDSFDLSIFGVDKPSDETDDSILWILTMKIIGKSHS